jgi:uncharacterized protein (UPF0332 family)
MLYPTLNIWDKNNIDNEIKRIISALSSRVYGDLRTICAAGDLTQVELEELIFSAVSDRVELAISLYKTAQTISVQLDKQDGDYRSIISRCYYCHYHLARALVFLITKDDIDNHEKLPKKLTECLKSDHILYALFVDRLDQYRWIRNEVDYSPYPEIDGPLDTVALQILQETEESIKLILQCFNERGIIINANI